MAKRLRIEIQGTRVKSLTELQEQVVACARCERLRTYCAEVAAATKRRAFLEQDYWGKPVPGFGHPNARLWIIGLAPAAHGGNRTGRVFTGDRSGDFLFAALHRAGYANQAHAVSREDGLLLHDCYISATAQCAPPANKPAPDEVSNCAGYLDEEWRLLRKKRVILALGKIAWDATLALARRNECQIAKPPFGSEPQGRRQASFGHGAAVTLCEGLTLLGSYHVSQQNTFTGKLTPKMFDAVLREAKALGATALRSAIEFYLRRVVEDHPPAD